MRKLVVSWSWICANEKMRSETRCRDQVKITVRESGTCIGHECIGDGCALELLLIVQNLKSWWGGSLGKHFLSMVVAKGRGRALSRGRQVAEGTQVRPFKAQKASQCDS